MDNRTKKVIFLSVIAVQLCFLNSCAEKKEYTDIIYQKPELVKNPESVFLSPEESIKTMYFPNGFDIQLVANEPMIEEPVCMAWGPDGKLYVAQMLTYMQDIDATDQDRPWSRISVLEDLDNDGKMDRSTVFLDSLVLPRILLPLDDRIIIGETYDRSLYTYRDTDGDNKADEKKLILLDTIRDNANLEHQSASLLWGIDNWLYLSNGPFRYRFENGELQKDTLYDAPHGQWGLTQDEIGQIYYSNAGGEVPALGYQQHPEYGLLEMQGKWEDGFEKVWPIIGTPDVQGGKRRLRENGTLNHFTASCGQEIFLGDALPTYGDLFIAEPVGRLVRRAKVKNVNGKKVLANVYDKMEFLASTDSNFRPVEIKSGPDGCLYVVDMYRGIIQEGNWVKPGSYLRDEVKKSKLDGNIGRGRIYRIKHTEIEPKKVEQLIDKSSEELITYLNHPNGWYRMTAQKLLVLRQDRTVVPELIKLVKSDHALLSLFSDKDKSLGRLHGFWTLEGLDGITEELVVSKLNDSDPRLRQAALRISERYLKAGNKKVYNAVCKVVNDKNQEVLVQLLLTLRSLPENKSKELVGVIMSRYPKNEVIQVVGNTNMVPLPPEIDVLKKQYVLEKTPIKNRIIRGHSIFKNTCTACHGEKGQGIEGLAPPLAGSQRISDNPEIPIKILLNGLSGPLEGKEYPGVMAGMKEQDNNWIASVLTYVRMHLNNSSQISPGQVNKVRKEVADRERYWTAEELY